MYHSVSSFSNMSFSSYYKKLSCDYFNENVDFAQFDMISANLMKTKTWSSSSLLLPSSSSLSSSFLNKQKKTEIIGHFLPYPYLISRTRTIECACDSIKRVILCFCVSVQAIKRSQLSTSFEKGDFNPLDITCSGTTTFAIWLQTNAFCIVEVASH